MIDKSSVIPLYYQIKQDIKEKIKNNVFAVNDPIPSESELIALYNVSRMTVRLAIEELEKEGYVKKIQGKGTFVKKRKLTQELNTITSWSETMRSQGMVAETTACETCEMEATEELAEQMNVSPGTVLYSIRRVKSVDGEPIGISHVYVVAEMAPDIIREPAIKQSIYQVMEKKYNIELATASEIVEARAADKEEAKVLNIEPGSPVITCKRLTFDPFGRTIELSQITSRADMYAYRVTLQGRKKTVTEKQDESERV